MKSSLCLFALQLTHQTRATQEDIVIKRLAPPTEIFSKTATKLRYDRVSRDAESGFVKVKGMSGMSKDQKREMVEITNKKRRQASPTAANMRRVVWDEELAEVAQTYADQCIFAHNPERKHSKFPQLIGENLMLVFPSNRPNLYLYNSSIIDVVPYGVDGWYDERHFYDYETRDCVPGKECGHYITLVNWKVYRVGCGLTQCTGKGGVRTNYESGVATNPLIMVCEYSHSPIVNFPPYLAGPSCTNCFGCASYSCAEEHYQNPQNCKRLQRRIPSLSCSGEACYNDMCISPLRDAELFKKMANSEPKAVLGRSNNNRLSKTVPEGSSDDSTDSLIIAERDQETILSCFDSVRSGVRPPAKKMPKTVWNGSMESIAEIIAEESCNGKIENVQKITGKISLTANIAASKNKPSQICAPIKFWGGGKRYYRFPKGKKGGYCKKGRKHQTNTAASCKDYAKVISEAAYSIGCAQTKCRDTTYRFVCVFHHTYEDFKKPYEHGKWCSACPKGLCLNNRLCNHEPSTTIL